LVLTSGSVFEDRMAPLVEEDKADELNLGKVGHCPRGFAERYRSRELDRVAVHACRDRWKRD
jgi:hypothetical protein